VGARGPPATSPAGVTASHAQVNEKRELHARSGERRSSARHQQGGGRVTRCPVFVLPNNSPKDQGAAGAAHRGAGRPSTVASRPGPPLLCAGGPDKPSGLRAAPAPKRRAGGRHLIAGFQLKPRPSSDARTGSRASAAGSKRWRGTRLMAVRARPAGGARAPASAGATAELEIRCVQPRSTTGSDEWSQSSPNGSGPRGPSSHEAAQLLPGATQRLSHSGSQPRPRRSCTKS